MVLTQSAHVLYVWERGRQSVKRKGFCKHTAVLMLVSQYSLRINLSQSTLQPLMYSRGSQTRCPMSRFVFCLLLLLWMHVDTSEQGSCWPGWPAWLCPGESSSVTVCIPGHIYRSSSPAVVWSWWTPRTFSVVELTRCVNDSKNTHTQPSSSHTADSQTQVLDFSTSSWTKLTQFNSKKKKRLSINLD